MINTKLTNILLITLLIFNVVFLTEWWIAHHRKFHHPPEKPETETTALLNDQDKGEMFLVKSLGLDSLQQKKLDTLLAVHFTFLGKHMGAYIRNQSNLFKALEDNRDSAFAFRCADSLGILKVTMEKELYLHFRSIKNICNTGQQKQFDGLIDNISGEFVHRHDLHGNVKAHHDSL